MKKLVLFIGKLLHAMIWSVGLLFACLVGIIGIFSNDSPGNTAR